MSSSTAVELWLINQYATNYPNAGFTRHHLLARAMYPLGIATTIFAAANSGPHKQKAASGERIPPIRLETTLDTRFAWLPARDYTGNGLGRIINMVGFGVTVVRRGWSPGQHGLPTPDAVIGSDPQPFATFAGWVLARRHRVPFILEVRDIWPESLVDILGVPRYHPLVMLFDQMEKFLYRHSTAIVGILPGVGDHVRERVGRRTPPFLWVPNGAAIDPVDEAPSGAANADRGAHADADTSQEPGETPNTVSDVAVGQDPAPSTPHEFTIVYAGAHGPPNSMETIVEAARLLETSSDTSTRFRFDFYGSGVSKEALMAEVRSHGMRSVHFHDSVPKSEVVDLVRKADASIINFHRLNLYRFGVSPNKVFDYLAAGRPVIIGLEAPHNPIELGNAGVLARPDDPQDMVRAIRSLAAMSPAERDELGRNGQRYVRGKPRHDRPGPSIGWRHPDGDHELPRSTVWQSRLAQPARGFTHWANPQPRRQSGRYPSTPAGSATAVAIVVPVRLVMSVHTAANSAMTTS